MKPMLIRIGKAAVICGAISVPATVQAFGGSFFDAFNTRPIGVSTGCNFNPYNDPGNSEAEISMFTAPAGNTTVGDDYWVSNVIISSSAAVTVADLESECPFTNVVILSQNGADQASYSAEDLVELEWSATFTGDGQSYTYRIAMEGVTNTVVVNTRTANSPPTSNAGPDQTVAVGTNPVTLDGSGSTDAETPGSLTYSWTQTGGTASVSLIGATTSAPTFTAPNIPPGADDVLEFTLVVNDGTLNSSPDTVAITVTAPANTSPTAIAGPNQSVAAAAGVTLDGRGSSDPDLGQTLTYNWTQTGPGTSVTLTGATTAQPTFTAPSPVPGGAGEVLTFRLVVNDGITDSVANDVEISVAPAPNVAPTAAAGGDQTVASGATVTLDGTGSDPNNAGQTLTYLWSVQSGGPISISNATAAMPTFTAPTLVFGDPNRIIVLQLVVSDGIAASAPDTVQITVTPPPNTAPVAEAGAPQTVLAGATVTLDGSASDAGEVGQVLTYLWSQTGSPAVTLSSAVAEMPTFTAPPLNIGDADLTLNFSLTVNDGFDGSTPDTVAVTVQAPPNTPPTADAGTNQMVVAGATVTLDATGSDANDAGQTLTYAWSQTGGTAVAFTATDAQPNFTAPSPAIGGAGETLTFSLVVNDGFEDSATATVQVDVGATPNTPPTANAGANAAVASGALVTLDAGASTPNDAGQVLTYLWSVQSGGPVTLSDATVQAPTFAAPTLVFGDAPRVIVLRLVVNDGFDSSAPSTVQITVGAPPNTAPVAEAGAPQTVLAGTSVTLDGSGSDAGEAGQVLTYRWSQTAGTLVTLSDNTAERPAFAAPAMAVGDANLTLTFSLIVNDGFADSVADTVSVTVEAPPNIAPTARAGADQNVASGAMVTLDGTGSTANDAGQVLTYAWTQTGGPGVGFTATAPMPGFTAPVLNIGDANAVLSFALSVNDGFDTSVPDTVQVTVRAPGDTQPPVIADPAPLTIEAGPDGSARVVFSASVTDNYDSTVTPVFTLGTTVITSPHDFAAGINNVVITAMDAAGNAADPKTLVITVTPATAPAAPLITTAVITADRSMRIGGTAEPGSTVRVTFPDASSVQLIAASGTGVYQVISGPDTPGGTITVTATDLAGNVSAPSTVELFPDYDRPSVTLSGAPATITTDDPFDVTITFSEDVTGFVVGDVTVIGASVSAFSGTGRTYIAEITPVIGSDITISVAADVAEDAFRNFNTASAVVLVSNLTATATELFVAEAMQARAASLIATQPKIGRFLLGGQQGSFNANVTQGFGNFTLATPSDRPIWLTGQGRWTTAGGMETSYAAFAMGGHLALRDNVILGAMAQFDSSTSEEVDASFDSTGWLVGPYLVARMPQQPLVFSAAYLMGQTDNTAAPLGTYKDKFTSDRSILTLGVAGTIEMPSLTLIPALDLAHLTDESAAYTDGAGDPVRAQVLTMTEATLGLDFILPVGVENGALDLVGGVGVASSRMDDGRIETTTSRGETSLGFRYQLEGGGRITGRATYDGLGDDDFEAVGGELTFEVSF